MLETIILYALLVATPLLLLAAAWGWLFRAGRMLSPKRRVPFLCGLTATTVAYVGQFLLRWYLRHAHLGFWPEVDVILGVGRVMLVAALFGFAASWFARGYGRVSSCSASLLVFVTWWLMGVAAL
jgi:hypothetical protein